ncbi:MAG: hypothetical protein IPK60_03285 [Sandaracinaceae bacterium]|nr:hypothetical protein [Sandaracinaceae bacterium]
MKAHYALAFFVLAGCAPASMETAGEESHPPATLDDLGTVVLSAESEAALALQTARVTQAPGGESVVVGGEVMVPAGQEVVLVAPVGGRVVPSANLPRPGDVVHAGQLLVTLVPLAGVERDARARAQRDLEAARADLTLSEQRTRRAELMMNDHSGSVRAFEEAQAQQHTAQATVDSVGARVRTIASGGLDSDVALAMRSPTEGILRSVRVAPGQSVPNNAVLFEITSSGRWIRASFTASDAAILANVHRAYAQRVGSAEEVPLTDASGPPSADPARGTVDRFFSLPSEQVWIPGERVVVHAAGLRADAAPALSVPWTSVVRDAEGSAWLYVKVGAHRFRRERVEVMRREEDRMLLRRGPPPGAEVVSTGSNELWGFELGADR